MRFAHLQHMREAKRRRFVNDPLFPLHLELHRLDCLGSHGHLDIYRFGMQEWLTERARPEPLAPLLTGRDVLNVGIPAGPEIGRILEATRDAQLEGTLASREQALTWLRGLATGEADETDPGPSP